MVLKIHRDKPYGYYNQCNGGNPLISSYGHAQEKAFKRITSADPTNVNARVGLASLYMNLGRFDDAVREYEAAAQSPYAVSSVHSQLLRQKTLQMRVKGASAEAWLRLEQQAANAVSKFGPVSPIRTRSTKPPTGISRFLSLFFARLALAMST